LFYKTFCFMFEYKAKMNRERESTLTKS